jgi:hypothetical protein
VLDRRRRLLCHSGAAGCITLAVVSVEVVVDGVGFFGDSLFSAAVFVVVDIAVDQFFSPTD